MTEQTGKRRTRRVLNGARQVELIHWFDNNLEFVKTHTTAQVVKRVNADLPSDEFQMTISHLTKMFKAYDVKPLKRGKRSPAAKNCFRDKLLRLIATLFLTVDDDVLTANERVELKEALDAFELACDS